MKTTLHKAESRGHANHGWLDTHHTFSFASYYNPERVHFGALRVLNDDKVSGGEGFGLHPHDNMEIVSIPLSGELEHRDSLGNIAVIKEGEIQVMSAGTGVFHSEYNKSSERNVEFLQIWIIPNKKNVAPRYDQLSIASIAKPNELYQILSPTPNDQGVWIYQNAWFYFGKLDKDWHGQYQLHDKNNGAYLFIIDGEAEVEDNLLSRRDGVGIWEADSINIKTKTTATILLMEIPMHV